MENYLENNLARFIHILRHLGITVSIRETVTALKALELVNIMDREHVRYALQATLVKNHEDEPIFNRAFNSFFTAPEIKRQQQEEWQEAREERWRLIDEAEQNLTYLGEKLDLSDEEKLLYSQLADDEKKRIRDYLESSFLPEDRYHAFKPMLEFQVRGSLRYWKQRLAEEGDLPCMLGSRRG